jgi:hypothetical protein
MNTFLSVNCTSLVVEVLYISPLDDSYLYIGSTAIVRVYVNVPEGSMEELRMTLSNGGENVDFSGILGYHNGNVNYTSSPFALKRYKKVSTKSYDERSVVFFKGHVIL